MSQKNKEVAQMLCNKLKAQHGWDKRFQQELEEISNEKADLRSLALEDFLSELGLGIARANCAVIDTFFKSIQMDYDYLRKYSKGVLTTYMQTNDFQASDQLGVGKFDFIDTTSRFSLL